MVRKQSGKYGKPTPEKNEFLAPASQELLSTLRGDTSVDWARAGSDLITVRLWEEDGWGQIVLARIFYEEDFGSPPW